MSPSVLLEQAKAGVVATVPTDAELGKADELLQQVLAQGRWSQDRLVKALTIPPGEDYLQNTMVRFLRARDGKVSAAVKMIDEAMSFRDKYDVDAVLSRPLAKDLLTHVLKGTYDGILPDADRFGRPVIVLQGGAANTGLHNLLKPPPGHTGDWDIHDLEDAWIHWHLIVMEYFTKVVFAEATAKAGKLVNKYIVLDDLKGFSVLGAKGLMNVLSMFKKCAMIDQLLYPELLTFLVFANSPAVFRGPWKVFSAFLDAKTNRKIFVLGGASQFRPALDVLFEPQHLPPFLGGTLAGNHVTSMENPHTEIFDRIISLVEENGKKAGFDASKRSTPMHVVSIPAGGAEKVTVQVEEGHIVEWQFVVKSHDVFFKAEFHDGTSTVVVRDPAKSIHSHDVRPNSMFRASSQGKLHLTFSNHHSRLRSKKVKYRVHTWKEVVAFTEGDTPAASQTESHLPPQQAPLRVDPEEPTGVATAAAAEQAAPPAPLQVLPAETGLDKKEESASTATEMQEAAGEPEPSSAPAPAPSPAPATNGLY